MKGQRKSSAACGWARAALTWLIGPKFGCSLKCIRVVADRVVVQRDLPQIAERADERPRPVHRESWRACVLVPTVRITLNAPASRLRRPPRRVGLAEIAVLVARQDQRQLAADDRVVQALVEADIEPRIGALPESLAVDLAGQHVRIGAEPPAEVEIADVIGRRGAGDVEAPPPGVVQIELALGIDRSLCGVVEYSRPSRPAAGAVVELTPVFDIELRPGAGRDHGRECRIRLIVDHPVVRLREERAEVRRSAERRVSASPLARFTEGSACQKYGM